MSCLKAPQGWASQCTEVHLWISVITVWKTQSQRNNVYMQSFVLLNHQNLHYS